MKQTMRNFRANDPKYARVRAKVTSALSVIAIAGLLGCATVDEKTQSGTYNHVGLFWLKEPGDPQKQQQLIDSVHLFAREIPEVKSVSVGRTAPQSGSLSDASFDICFTMTFEDRAALERYARHPVHVKAAEEVFLPLSEKILFYGFISEGGKSKP